MEKVELQKLIAEPPKKEGYLVSKIWISEVNESADSESPIELSPVNNFPLL